MAGLTYGDVKTWRAGPLGKAAHDVKKDADALEESRDKIESQTVPPSWLGRPSEHAADLRHQLLKQINTHLEGKRQLQKALGEAADQVIEIEGRVKDVEAQARSDEFWIGDDGVVNGKRTEPEIGTPEYEQWHKDRNKIYEAITTIFSLAAAAEATITRSIPEGHVRELDEYGTVSPEVAAYWAKLTDLDRQAIIVQLAEERAEESGIDRPLVSWDPRPAPTGSWIEDTGRLAIDLEQLDDPDVLHTVAHAMRHAHQYEVVRDMNDLTWPGEVDPFDEHEEDGITPEQAEKWEENLDDYTPREEDSDEYWKQPVEVDAREAGRECVEGMTKAKLKRLLERAAGSAPG